MTFSLHFPLCLAPHLRGGSEVKIQGVQTRFCILLGAMVTFPAAPGTVLEAAEPSDSSRLVMSSHQAPKALFIAAVAFHCQATRTGRAVSF